MDNINFEKIFNRIQIANSIENTLNRIINDEKNIKKGIYLYGDYGIGKTSFIINLLKKNNYDIIYYDSISIKNKNIIQNISNTNLSTNNVYNLFYNNNKKIVVVIDDINSFNTGDKNIISNLIKLIREKKTKRQKSEYYTKNPIICINTNCNDKKILELMNVCNVYKINTPTNEELRNIIYNYIPELYNYPEILINNIINFLNNKLYNLHKIKFYYNNNLLFDIFNSNNDNIINNINCIKINTQTILEKNTNLNNLNYILESNRTIVSLLIHENIIKLFNKNNYKEYLKILDNYIYCDYIDRIIFQKQVWQLIEINYIIKIFYNNFLLNKFNLFKFIEIDDIIFTKILTKYSSEYNNFVFIYNLLQTFMIDKKDMLLMIYNEYNYIENFLDKLYTKDITKLEILRIMKFMNNINNYNIEKNIDDNEENIEDLCIMEIDKKI